MKIVKDFWNIKSKSNFKSKAPKKRNKGLFKLKEVQFYKTKKVPQKQMNWAQARKFKKLKPFGDWDKDKVPNFIDCKPFDRKKHDSLPRYRKKTYRKYLPEMKRMYTRGKEASDKEHFRMDRRKKQGKEYITQKRMARVNKEGLYLTLSPTMQANTEYYTGRKFDKRLIVDKTEPKGKRVKGFTATLPTKEKGVRELDIIYVTPKERKRGYGKKAIRDLQKDPRVKKYIAKTIVEDDEDVKKWKKLGGKTISKEEYEKKSYIGNPPIDLPDDEQGRKIGETREKTLHYVELKQEPTVKDVDTQKFRDELTEQEYGGDKGELAREMAEADLIEDGDFKESLKEDSEKEFFDDVEVEKEEED